MNERKILFLTHRLPYPPIGGDRLKSYWILRHLSEIAKVDLISLDEMGSTASDVEHVAKLSKLTLVPFDKVKAAVRVIKSLFSSTPIEFAYYAVPEMQQAVSAALSKSQYDLIICFFLRTADYVKNIANTPKLLIAEDARVILQERASKKFEFTPQFFVRKIDAIRLRRYEPQHMTGFDKVTFVSSIDEHRIGVQAPELHTGILSNGVDTERLHFYAGERQNSLLFLGHLGIYHNRLMAARLVEKIFPMIRRVSPGTKLIIAGSEPRQDLIQRIHKTEGAELHSNVEEVSHLLRSAKVFVHPQTVGAGIQNKLLEAMACGLPVVTTPVGAEGIEGAEDNVHLLIRTSDRDIAEAALRLINSDETALRLSRNGRGLIEERYTWGHVFRKLDKVIEELVPKFFEKNPVSIAEYGRNV